MMPVAPRSRKDFKVAIFCALSLEAENVQAVFDKCWEDEEKRYGKAVGDQNSYSTGMIGKYNVVLVHMYHMGTISAALSAAGLRSSFPEIKLALVVGICGVVPVHPETKEEIILGDIIVSTAVTQYDFGRQYPHGFERKMGTDDSLGRASPEIRSFVRMLQTRQNRKRLTQNLARLVHSEDFKKGVPTAKYPGANQDRLYEASYNHQHRRTEECELCHNNHETCSKSCDDLGCEDVHLVPRDRHGLQHMETEEGSPEYIPSIHLGRFGSADYVMKSGIDRDRIALADKLSAFEMESAKVWEQYQTIVIKAACDYADSHKNKDWQGYAASMAAACLKVVFKEWIVTDQLSGIGEFLIPFDPIPGFVGRVDELEMLDQKLFDPNGLRVVSILGLGGMGKSRLAIQFAYHIKSKHPQHSVFWIQAADQLTFENDIREVGKKLGILGIENDKTDIKALVKQRLSQSEEKWVLIFDNADDEALWEKQSDPNLRQLSLVDYIPRTTNGSILITTRSRCVATSLAGKEVIDIHALSPYEGVDMFMNRLESPNLAADRVALSSLLEKLTYLPLAIVQAASFINMTQQPVETYSNLLDEPEPEVIKLLSTDFSDESRYPNAMNPVTTTWLISFKYIQKNHLLAATFLSFMACLHEKGIPLSLLPYVDSKFEAVKAIGVLTGYSFVTRQTSSNNIAGLGDLYDMHRLVQIAARNWLSMENLLIKSTKACIKRMTEVFPREEYEHKSIWSAYLPHARRLCESTIADDFPERYLLLQQIGGCLLHDGKYKEAIRVFTMVMDWRDRKSNNSDRGTPQLYNNLGMALLAEAEWSTAEKYLKRAADLARETVGPEQSRTLITLANLATIYRRQGKLLQAEELGLQVFEIQNNVLGIEHPETLTNIANLALTCSYQGRFQVAEKLEIQVLERRKKVLGIEHPDTLTVMGNLASTYGNQGRLQEAEELGLQVLEIRKKVLGIEHPETLANIANLALIYSDQGRLQEAEELALQVLEIRKKVLGTGHPDTLTILGNLALTYWKQGRFQEAEELEIQVLETGKKVFGIEHPATLTMTSNLATTYGNQGRLQEAEELEIQALEIRKKVLGTEHPDTLTSMNNLAYMVKSAGRHDEAIKLMESCHKSVVKALGSNHPHTRDVQETLAKWLSDKNIVDQQERESKLIPGAWID